MCAVVYTNAASAYTFLSIVLIYVFFFVLMLVFVLAFVLLFMLRFCGCGFVCACSY